MEPVAFLKEKDMETSLNKYWGYVEQRGVSVMQNSNKKLKMQKGTVN